MTAIFLRRLFKYQIFLQSVWAVIIILAILYHYRDENEQAIRYATLVAQESLNKDLLYRRWNAASGGVYAQVSKQTPANPHLEQSADRDIVTIDGKQLTKINPAYMTRQVHELASATSGSYGHITSLKPLRPENAPDAWEAAALQRMETTRTPIADIIAEAGAPYLRLMVPLATEESCLGCHQAQGYHVGDLRGGLSTGVPLAPFLASASHQQNKIITILLLIWGAGASALGFGHRRLQRFAIQQEADHLRLEDSEKRFSNYVHSTDGIVWEVELPSMCFTFVSQQAERLLGYPLAEWLQPDFWAAHLHPEDRDWVVAYRHDKAERLEDHAFECRFLTRDGRVVWLRNLVRVVVVDGKASRLTGTMFDITESKRNIIALDEYRQAVDASKDMICVVDDQYRYVLANPCFLQYTGRTREELIGWTVAEVLGEPLFATVKGQIDECLTGKVVHFEMKRILPDLGWRDVDVTYAPIPGGKRMVCLIRDVTEFKQAQEVLLEYRAALEASQDMICVLDSERRYTLANSAFLNKRKMQWDQVVGQHVTEVLGTDIYTRVEERLNRSYNGSTELFEMTVAYPEIGERSLLVSYTPLRSKDQEGVDRVVAVITDVSMIKQAERELRVALKKAEDASRAKSEFLANMSHELRTPLNGVLGMMQLLETTDLDSEQKEYVTLAFQSGNGLLELLQDILDLSSIEAGRLPLVYATFAPQELVRGIMANLQMGAESKGLAFSVVMDGSVPTNLYGCPARLRQILLNLLGNAIKFTETGNVRCCIGIEEAAGPQHRLRLIITDTGIGIEEENLRKIFEPFMQVEGTYRRRFQGVGLGLAIVKRLVEMLDGEITIASRMAEGTTVTVIIPVLIGDPKSVAEVLPPTVSNQEPRRGNILLAEDNPVNQRVVSAMLEKAGYTVTVVADGRQALRHLASEPCDLVLMDVQMPVMDGVEATRLIRAGGERGSTNPSIPIVAITAHAMVNDRAQFLAAGMDDYLCKPLQWEDLRECIERNLKSAVTPLSAGYSTPRS